MHLLGNGLTPQQHPGAFSFTASLSLLAPGLGKIRLGGINTGLVWTWIDQEQQISLLYQLSLLEGDFLDIAADSRP